MKKIFCFVFLLFSYAHSLIVDINEGTFQPHPIVLEGLDDSDLTEEAKDIIHNDLKNSGFFDLEVDKDDLRFIVKIKVTQDPAKGINAGFFEVFDVLLQKKHKGEIENKTNKLRQLSHQLSDAIFEIITHIKGHFSSKIIFVKRLGERNHNERKKLIIMDQDGENQESLTKGNIYVTSPRFSPDGKQVAYLSYAEKTPQIHLMDLRTMNSRPLGRFKGMSFAPRFSPDGKSIVMSVSKSNGTSAIYTKNLKTKKFMRLTSHNCLQTSPCYDPDGKNIVYTSDESGKEHLYMMNYKGGNKRRISFGYGKYSQPVFSPDGKYIAFTKKVHNEFYIGVMKPDGTGERLITQAYCVESPTWSPNGQYIVFTKEDPDSGEESLYRISLRGDNLQRVNTPEDCSDCSWQ